MPSLALAQEDSIRFLQPSKEYKSKRLLGVLAAEGFIYVGSMVGLNYLWYSDYPRTSFHFFDDSDEWLQMDKAGHFFSSYHMNNIGMYLFRWSGVEKTKSIWFGGEIGTLFLLTIEILDGHSTNWGASWGDLIANTAGRMFSIGQQALWDEQRITLKFSFHESVYSMHRPNVLGSNFIENLFKDYNGQTYWMSFNIASFLKEESKFPKWLNVALGYSADGMTGGSSNPTIVEGQILPIPEFDRSREFFFSLDLDLTRIKTKSPLLKAVLSTVGCLKFPFPTLEYHERDGFIFHPYYF